MMAACLEQRLASQTAGAESVLVIEVVDHELTQFDGKAYWEMHLCAACALAGTGLQASTAVRSPVAVRGLYVRVSFGCLWQTYCHDRSPDIVGDEAANDALDIVLLAWNPSNIIVWPFNAITSDAWS
jgi:hypothetical protein